MTDWKGLCAEMLNGIELDVSREGIENPERFQALIDRTRAELAQPELEGPSDEELDHWWAEIDGGPDCCAWRPYARAALARYARPAIEPVPVGDRWPEFSDCDQCERVWVWNPILEHWKLTRLNRSIHTHWLPHYALPVPTSQP